MSLDAWTLGAGSVAIVLMIIAAVAGYAMRWFPIAKQRFRIDPDDRSRLTFKGFCMSSHESYDSGIIERLIQRVDAIARRLEMTPFERGVLARLDRLDQTILALIEQGTKIMAEIDDLMAQAKATEDTEEAAVIVLQGLAGQIATLTQNATDLATLKGQLGQLTTELKAKTDPLAAAIATPA
jgi:hypothetical protein